MCEITRVSAVAPDRERHPFFRLFQEFPDRLRICPLRIKTRTICIEIAQAYALKSVDIAPRTAQHFSHILLQPVRAVGHCLHALRNWYFFLITIDGTRARVNDPLNATLVCCAQP